ncbi:hypothetical protein A2966_03100 [Candidatus Roizmanbacteria bacterium RIFCSPLOWO2_01_FULL_41_22]|uniref:tRNA/rRNA methyltransferase SpoU type domain-containing protein n=1 Tax=Candidatus Roizmanbacteria bacterium RIFCSPLOWO2_01_FULL_41_22 TaxID=1802067 RepID=A0A1F7J746_9BACT|nr:MAG: hypothetical protein A2966_03100 [Candidatus Roizmanbacteria bacterium RIFCSPLOWO2_01_FULL_41_22]
MIELYFDYKFKVCLLFYVTCSMLHDMRYNARQLRELKESTVQSEVSKIKRRPLYFILENIYDTYNVGGLFRLADALAVERMYLCGQTEIPPNAKIKKASIGTYKVVPWIYKTTVVEAIEDLKSKVKSQKSKVPEKEIKPIILKEGKRERLSLEIQLESKQETYSNIKSTRSSTILIIAVEQDKRSIDYRKADYILPLALVFGNETFGVLPETLDAVDKIVEIPMWGVNKSLNVIVSAAIVSYQALARS